MSGISFDEAIELAAITSSSDILSLVARANALRTEVHGSGVDLCSIVNARSGNCSENCSFCPQSVHHSSVIDKYPMKNVAEILRYAHAAEEAGAHRFCIVTSGKRLSRAELEIALEAISRIRNETNLLRCASMGILSPEEARELKAAGLIRYHHNLETARSFFPHVCTTHTYEEKLATIAALKDAGIEPCVGGILNLGESDRQRVELAFEIKAVSPVSVPINFLNPRSGTALSHRALMKPIEAVKWLAILRLIMPEPILRICGGRVENLGDLQALGVMAGVNGLLIGNYLTTIGRSPDQDLEMLRELSYDVVKA